MLGSKTDDFAAHDWKPHEAQDKVKVAHILFLPKCLAVFAGPVCAYPLQPANANTFKHRSGRVWVWVPSAQMAPPFHALYIYIIWAAREICINTKWPWSTRSCMVAILSNSVLVQVMWMPPHLRLWKDASFPVPAQIFLASGLPIHWTVNMKTCRVL